MRVALPASAAQSGEDFSEWLEVLTQVMGPPRLQPVTSTDASLQSGRSELATVVRQGVLTKCNKNGHFWRKRCGCRTAVAVPRVAHGCRRCGRRYFVLHPHELMYYGNRDEAAKEEGELSGVRGVVSLVGAEVLVGPGDKIKPPSSLFCLRIVSDDRIFYLCAEVRSLLWWSCARVAARRRCVAVPPGSQPLVSLWSRAV